MTNKRTYKVDRTEESAKILLLQESKEWIASLAKAQICQIWICSQILLQKI
jgi:hypothetical protein